jgi:hypothetical protein
LALRIPLSAVMKAIPGFHPSGRPVAVPIRSMRIVDPGRFAHTGCSL